MEWGAFLDGKFCDLRLADGAKAELVDCLVEALGEQSVDDFLADFGGETAENDGFRNLASAEAGDFGVFAIAGGDVAPGPGDVFSRNIDDQLTGAFGIENRAVRVVVGFFGVVVLVLGVSRFGFAFEGAAGTQRFTFRARAPI